MEKTAVQIAIENVDQCLNLEDVKGMLGILLEMEKQNIIEAFEIGYENGACTNENESIYHGSNYYNKTFKSE